MRGASRNAAAGVFARLLLAAALLLAASGAGAGSLTPEEEAGKKVFEQGTSPDGDITARVGTNTFAIPGSAVPCATCHGPDGLGRPEGGLEPPNIQWSELTKPYGHVHPNGRKHPAFDEISLRKAFTFGIDPAGNELDPAMPHYKMPEAASASLIAYLKKLEFQLPPGVSADRLRLGTVLPTTGRFGEVGQAVRGLLEAYFATINQAGGLYGRKIELKVAEYGDKPEAAYANAWDLVRKGDVFALIAPFSAGWEGELGQIAAGERIPVVAPITLFPEDTRASNLYVFHLLSGVSELGQVLADYAADKLALKDKPVALVHSATKAGRELAEGVQERMVQQGWKGVTLQPFQPGERDASGFVRTLRERGVRALIVVGTGMDLGAVAREAAKSGWAPYLLLPGQLAPRDITELPGEFAGKVFLAYPTLPADQKPYALQQYAAMFQSGQLARAHQTIQVPAYVAALATVEALRRAGRDVTRAKFVGNLETLQSFDTGLLPPLSYNSDRRIGAMGGYIVAVDLPQKQFRPVGGFVGLK